MISIKQQEGKHLKRLRKIYLIIAVFFTVFSVIFSAPSYRIDSLDITAKIQEDGSVVIEEIALYNASENYIILMLKDMGNYSLWKYFMKKMESLFQL